MNTLDTLTKLAKALKVMVAESSSQARLAPKPTLSPKPTVLLSPTAASRAAAGQAKEKLPGDQLQKRIARRLVSPVSSLRAMPILFDFLRTQGNCGRVVLERPGGS